jgi:hypothetical protein
LAKRKAQGLDGIVDRFYVRLWHIVNKDYFNMVKNDVPIGRFHKGVTKVLIILIFKVDFKVQVELAKKHGILV